jgi:hypothetical protein
LDSRLPVLEHADEHDHYAAMHHVKCTRIMIVWSQSDTSLAQAGDVIKALQSYIERNRSRKDAEVILLVKLPGVHDSKAEAASNCSSLIAMLERLGFHEGRLKLCEA